MKVSLRTYGGLLGGLGQSAHVVDGAQLGATDQTELRKLVAAATTAPAPSEAGLVRDGQTYEIEIEDHGETMTLEASDGGVPEAFAELRDWIRNH